MAVVESHRSLADPLLYEDVKRRGTPLDWMEPETLRRALTQLGAREEVVPASVKAVSRSERTLDRCWSAEDLVGVIEALADAGQLVLGFQLWERERWGESHRWQ